MKAYIYLILLITLSISFKLEALAQNKNILGVWQIDSPLVGDAWLDSYQFFPNGRFIFNFSQYNDISRIIAIEGKYKLVGDTLITRIERRKELIDGLVVRGDPGFQNEWTLIDAKPIYVKQNKIIPDTIKIETWETTSENIRRIWIFKNWFYLIDRNPNKYEK